jgi:hypothetical protein
MNPATLLSKRMRMHPEITVRHRLRLARLRVAQSDSQKLTGAGRDPGNPGRSVPWPGQQCVSACRLGPSCVSVWSTSSHTLVCNEVCAGSTDTSDRSARASASWMYSPGSRFLRCKDYQAVPQSLRQRTARENRYLGIELWVDQAYDQLGR